MALPFLFVVLLLIIVWLGYITFSLRKISSNYAHFTNGSNKKTLDEVLHSLANEAHISRKDISKLRDRCDTMEKNEQLHIQKIGLLRFNPFKDTGGDQSFILSLVDAQNTGVVITALYSRSGTRWYAKRVEHGKGVELDLSDEEKKALKAAEKAN